MFAAVLLVVAFLVIAFKIEDRIDRMDRDRLE
jgi:hypothetical protein